jgi:N2-acetyl-L-2,4-diaminobutanoate deacetylase
MGGRIMATSRDRVSTEIDFAQDGKQVSYLAAAISTNKSAYGTVPIPITVIKNGAGPTIFFTGGNHGDEYEGQIALMKLARRLEPSAMRGRVIIIPCLNLPAVLAGTRLSPIDGQNLNRVFPGDPRGSITLAIADFLTAIILPLCDVQVDLHSGGSSLEFLPCINMKRHRDKRIERRSLEALRAFAAPYGLLNLDIDNAGLLESQCEEMGILTLSTELGGGGGVNPDYVAIAERGIQNLLRHFGHLDGETRTPAGEEARPDPVLLQVPDLACYAMAPDDGIYEPFVRLGDAIELGQVLGQVHYPAHIDKAPWVVHAARRGLLLARRVQGGVVRGDNVAVIAEALDPADV